MASLTQKKKAWDITGTVGKILMGGNITFGLLSGAGALWMGVAKAAVVTAAVTGAVVPVILGGAALIASTIMVNKIEKKIEASIPHLTPADLKKLIPATPEAAPAPQAAPAPDLSKEFSAGTDAAVDAMKPLHFKPQARGLVDKP